MNFRILFCMLITNIGYPQNNAFDSLYQHTTQVILTSTPQNVFKHIHDLKKKTTTEAEQIEVYLLKASLLRQYGVRDQAIATLKKADSLATNTKNATLQARIQGSLSTLYRENGIESLGKIALNKAKNWSKQISDPVELTIFEGNLQQEQAYYHMKGLRFSDALLALDTGRKVFEKIELPERRSFYLASTDQLIGENYIKMREYVLAIRTLELAQRELAVSDQPESPLKGFIYNNLGMAHLLNQDYETAVLFLHKAQQVAEQSDFLALKKQVFASLSTYAKKIGDAENFVLYNEKYVKLVEQELSVQAKISNYLVESYYEKEDELSKAYQKYVGYSLSIGGGILLFLSFAFYYRRKQMKQEAVRVQGDVAPLLPSVEERGVEENKSEGTVDHNYISKEMEDLILTGIQHFERQQGFLKHEISLSKLASQIGVNHRYVSYVIKHHKHQDFSSYINTLRINYIVELLQANPEMLKYKISYLADLCGFASHSRFTITFKRIKGISPSAFIEQIKKKT
ncbi:MULTISPECIES: helix-turn-helix domain-containing protein [unclassified Myroides]|uniref:helix-turn-helix domain-containing protein n=1 Tax=unclassified Myroides TaxID=2642485 RepID=UPI003D2F551F